MGVTVLRQVGLICLRKVEEQGRKSKPVYAFQVPVLSACPGFPQ